MIQQISLNNFKCFEDETIDFAPLTLLTGLNGMGKSTVIQALLLLRQNHELGLLQNDRGILLNGDLVQIGNSRDLLYQYFESRKIEVRIIVDEGDKEISGFWKWDASADSDILPLKGKSIENDDVFNSSLFNSNFHYLNAERIGPRVYFETSNFKVINQNQLGIRGEFAVNYLSEYQKDKIPIEELKHPDTEGSTLYEQVNAWLSEIRPGTRIDVTSNIDMSLVGLSYQFVGGRDVGNKFRPTNVGFGLSFFLPVIVAILSSKPGSLLLLENPEAHLHPMGQARIGRLLALAAAHGIQVILETHSDHIINGVRVALKEGLIKPEETKFLFFTGEVIEDQFKNYILDLEIDRNGRFMNELPDGFFDEWDRQLTKLL